VVQEVPVDRFFPGSWEKLREREFRVVANEAGRFGWVLGAIRRIQMGSESFRRGMLRRVGLAIKATLAV
jgi:hypothetical protein